jgi:hypothetical protein
MLSNGLDTAFPVADDVEGVRFEYFLDPDPETLPRPPLGAGNCVFSADDPPRVLLVRQPGSALWRATPRELVDGPVCGSAPDRFDGDLLRIRQVRVTVRLGLGRGSRWRTPAAQSATFDVTPRNLNLGR